MTFQKFGIPKNVRLSLKLWYALSCSIGETINIPMSDKTARIVSVK